MSEIEIEVERQLLYPGDAVSGRVLISGPGPQEVTVSLQGEEVYRPYLGFDTIQPVLEESVVVHCKHGEGRFSFELPSHVNPSYSSDHLRCAYYLKATRFNTEKILGFNRSSIARLHLTVAAATQDYDLSAHELKIANEDLSMEIQVDQVSLEAGEILTGSFILTRLKEDGALPESIVFSLATIEEMTKGTHRNVLWRLENSIKPTADLEYPLIGSFELPVEDDSPTSGDWGLFKVHCGFRVRLDWGAQKDQRESLPIQLRHAIVPWGPAPFTMEVGDRPERLRNRRARTDSRP